jgi:hypothetical protein
MEHELKQRLTSRNIWTRALFMVLFAIAYGLVEIILTLLVVVQFFVVLLTARANEPLLKFGTNLGRYVYQIIQFQTFNSEDKPFPFSDWPEDEVSENQWLEDPEVEEAVSEHDLTAEDTAPDAAVADDSPVVDDNVADDSEADRT